MPLRMGIGSSVHNVRNMIKVQHYKNERGRERAFPPRVLYAGTPFEFRSERRSEGTLRYKQHVAELNLLSDALGPTHFVPDAIEPLKTNSGTRTPDFALHFGSKVIYCECTAAGKSEAFAWQMNVNDWSEALSSRAMHDSSINRILGERYVAFIPAKPPKTKNIASLVDEAAKLLAKGDLAKFEGPYGIRAPDKYPGLSSLDTIVTVGHSKTPQVFVQMPAMSSGGLHEAVQDLTWAFRKKAKQSYKGFRPIWLIIAADQIIWKLSEATSEFAKVVGVLSPFERIFFANSSESYVLSEQ